MVSCSSATVAEALAVLEACRFASEVTCANIIIENDAFAVWKAITSQGPSHWTFHLIIEDIQKIVTGAPHIEFQHVPRTANKTCDWIVRMKARESLQPNWQVYMPEQLHDLLLYDQSLTGIG